MFTIDYLKSFCKVLGFSLENGSVSTWIKNYSNHDNYALRVNFNNQRIDYGALITVDHKAICNFEVKENFVVLECVNRLLEKGYSPQNIILEQRWSTGHGTSGKLDILITNNDGTSYLMIECKTYGIEFNKELNRIYKNGGQLFTYFQQDKDADILMLYSSEMDKEKTIKYRNEIIRIEENYRQAGNVRDFYDCWNKLTKNNGVFDSWVNPYNFQSKALTPKNLQDIKQEDSSFIFNQFLEILRHNVVSDKPNAFNKIFTLFLCKIYDEKSTKPDDELAFQWFYTSYQYNGVSYQPDDYVSFQKRLTDLYKKGMKEFLDKEITDISDSDIQKRYGTLDETTRQKILNDIVEIRLKKNNEFAIKEVFDESSFQENAKIVKEVVELLQNFKIRYTSRQQYLSDFFELLLTTGLKQESGQFFTPVPIAQFIIKSIPLSKMVHDKLCKGERENLLPTIIDYATGSGHFITESMHEIQRIIDKIEPKEYGNDTAKKIISWKVDHFDWAYDYVYGIEKDYRLVKVSKVGCYLHGDGLAQVIHGDGLASFSKTLEYKDLLKKTDKSFPNENKQFDIVVSNPPYSVSAFKNNSRKYFTEDDFELYHSLTDQSSEIECLFVERTKQLLKDDGLAGIILPSSILSNTGIYTKTRELILQYFEIIAIAEFGSNTFMATGTNTVTLFLKRRNNYDCKNINSLIEGVISTKKEVTINNIEKPLSKYINHVWHEIEYNDYISLLNASPNSKIESHSIYKDYRQKLKYKNEKEFWDKVIKLEHEKILYFILAYPQKIVLVKTGEKNEEKNFLGYEFSNRRGNEGIHPIQRGKSIEECTQLFDSEIFDNPKKASTYVYKAFQGDVETEIDDSLSNNIIRLNLVDMMTFDRPDFEKNISLAVKKKIESKWPLAKLGTVCEIKIGATPRRDNYAFYANGIYPWVSIAEMNGEIILDTKEKLSELGVKKSSVKLVKKGATLLSFKLSIGKTAIAGRDLYTNEAIAGLEINQDYKTKILDKFLFIIFEQRFIDLEKGGFNTFGKSLNSTFLKDNVKIPLPPRDIQEKIVDEIEFLEEKEKRLQSEIQNSRNAILSSVKNNSTKQKIEYIATMLQRGKSPKYGTSAIQIIKSGQARGFKNFDFSKKYYVDNNFVLDKRKLEKGDILINSSGVGTAGRVTLFDLEGDFVVDSHISILRLDKTKALSCYVLYSLADIGFKTIESMATGQSGQIELSLTTIQNITIPLPSIEEQQKIVTQIELIENAISDLQTELDKIPYQKQYILKKYLQYGV